MNFLHLATLKPLQFMPVLTSNINDHIREAHVFLLVNEILGSIWILWLTVVTVQAKI